MPRPPVRFLGRNHGTEVPSNLLFFDTESFEPIVSEDGNVKRLTLRMWCATAVRFDGDKVSRVEKATGSTPQEFAAFADNRCQREKPLWAFAHNANFDLTLLDFWAALEAGYWRHACGPEDGSPHGQHRKKAFRGRLCMEDRPFFLYLMGRKGPVRFIDSANYYPTALEAVGKSFGVDKMAMPDWGDSDAVWRAYCERDVLVLQTAIINLLRMWKREDCGVFRATAPGLALQNFKHTCDLTTPTGDKIDLVIEPGHAATALERQGYMGGRVEAFYTGPVKQDVWLLDVNSLYPAMMQSQLFPRKRLKTMQAPSVDKLARHMIGYDCLAAVRLKTRIDTYPLRHHGVQYHCNGEFDAVLCGPELRRALRSDHVVSCSEAVVYCMAPIFRSWVDRWFQRKLDAINKGDAGKGELELVKMILNSLSAKWAQKGEFWETHHTRPPCDEWGTYPQFDADRGELRIFRNVAQVWQEYVTGQEPEHSFPAISAFVTSYSREYMRDLIVECPPESVYYIGTDCLLVNLMGYEALKRLGWLHETNIGLLKVKGVYKDAEVFGTNHYRVGDKVIRSGQHAKAVWVKGRGWVYESWQGARGTIAQRPDASIAIHKVTLKKERTSPKGKRKPDGWHEPFRLSIDSDFTDQIPKAQVRDRPSGEPS